MSERYYSYHTFSRIVGKPFLWMTDKVFGTLCTCLLFASCILPWRFVEITAILENLDTEKKKYRRFALSSFVLTLLDFVVVPLGIVSLMSPRIFVHVFMHYIYLRKLDNRWDITQASVWRARKDAVKGFFGTVGDLLSLPFMLCALMSPSRSHIVISETSLTINRFLEYQGTLDTEAAASTLSLMDHWCDFDDWLHLWTEMDFLWCEQGVAALIDVV